MAEVPILQEQKSARLEAPEKIQGRITARSFDFYIRGHRTQFAQLRQFCNACFLQHFPGLRTDTFESIFPVHHLTESIRRFVFSSPSPQERGLGEGNITISLDGSFLKQ